MTNSGPPEDERRPEGPSREPTESDDLPGGDFEDLETLAPSVPADGAVPAGGGDLETMASGPGGDLKSEADTAESAVDVGQVRRAAERLAAEEVRRGRDLDTLDELAESERRTIEVGTRSREAAEDGEADLDTFREVADSERDTMEVDLQAERAVRTRLDGGGAPESELRGQGTEPGGGVAGERGLETVAGGFVGTARPGGVTRSGGATGGEDGGETAVDPGATDRGRRTGRTKRDYTSRRRRRGTGTAGTARDPAAGTAANRGTRPGSASTSVVLREGELLADRYELVERLGKGGMGEVWKARHTLLRGMRAVKVIKASISRDPAFRARFLTEGQTMMRVKHPGVVEVTDLDETRSSRELFMVMEHLDGRTVYDGIRDPTAPLCDDQVNAVRILREVALGMQRIHEERIVHKDLKSDNVLLVKDADGVEHPKVIDFGLAKRLDAKDPEVDEESAGGSGYDPDLRTTLSGTLAYMAPEQFANLPSSFQSDVYAFGVMAYELFSKGSYPLPRGNLSHYVELHKDGARPTGVGEKRPDLDPFVTGIVDQCLEIRREDRPESFRWVAEQLLWWLEIPERRRRRNRILAVAGGFAVLLAVILWQVFFATAPAPLTRIALRAGADLVPAVKEKRYVGSRHLADLTFECFARGGAADPVVFVGETQISWIPKRAGVRLAGPLDLSGVPDGEYQFVARAAPSEPPNGFKLVVDRVPPKLLRYEVEGDRGGYTSAATPTLRLWFDGTDTASVECVLRQTKDLSATAKKVPDGDHWEVSLPVEMDGEVKMEVRFSDVARNSGVSGFTFRRDTELVEPEIAGVPAGGSELHVRVAVGGFLKVLVGEPGNLRVEAAGRVLTDRTCERPQTVDVALPAIPSDGTVPVTIRFEDRAGTVARRALSVSHVPDVATLRSADGKAATAATGEEPVKLELTRNYSFETEPTLLARRTRDADGSPVHEVARAVEDVTFSALSHRHQTVLVQPRALSPGAYVLSVSGVGDAKTDGMTLVVDQAQPVIGAGISTVDADGHEVAPDGWNRTRAVTVRVEVSDLSLVKLTLDETPPREILTTGTRVYTFRKQFRREGPNPWTLVATDATGASTETTVTVQADWTPPSIVLDSPKPGAKGFNQTESVTFSGSCSEDRFTLWFSGLKARRPDTPFPFRGGGGFSAQVELDDHPTPYTVSVVAEDRAGNRSRPVEVSVFVERLEQKRMPQIAWTQGVAADMRLVAEGDVVIGRDVHSVHEVYLDRTEVTNAQYRLFLAAVASAGGSAQWDHPEQPKSWDHTPPAETWEDAKWRADGLPVVNVAFWDAYAFAEWTGRRLPDEGEWVKAAAKDPDRPKLRKWPPFGDDEWKDGHLVTREAFAKGDWRGPAPAGTGKDESPAHCLHMGGNVSEWVRLPYARTGEESTGTRGGSWFYSSSAANVRLVPAKAFERSHRSRTVGFRCAVDASVAVGESEQ